MTEGALAQSPDFTCGALDVERTTAESGDPTARVRREGGAWIWLHSRFNPVAEARELVDSALLKDQAVVVAFGLGLGYHVKEIVARTRPDTAVLVVDPYVGRLDPHGDLLRAAADAGPSSRRFVVCHTDLESLQQAIPALFSMKGHGGIGVVEHPPSVDLAPEFYRAVRGIIRDALIFSGINTRTRQVLAGTWLENFAQNLPYIARDPGIEGLRDLFKDRTAIVVAAGPSLNRNVEALRAASGKAILIAAGSGHAVLRRHGLKADVVMTVDPTPTNGLDFQVAADPQTALVYESKATPSVLRCFAGPRFNWVQPDGFGRWMARRLGARPGITATSTVAYSAFSFARHLGARRIVFAGLDLALTDGQSHAAGVAVARTIEMTADPSLLRVPGFHGGEVTTTRLFYTFLRLMENAFAAAASDGIEIIDATEGGARKLHTAQMTLADAVASCCQEEVDIFSRLQKVYEASRSGDRVIRRVTSDLRSLVRRMERLERLLVRAAERIKELQRVTQAFDTPGLDTFRPGLAERAKETFRDVYRENHEINTYGDIVDLVDMGLFFLQFVEHGRPEDLPIDRQMELNALFYVEILTVIRRILPHLKHSIQELEDFGACATAL